MRTSSLCILVLSLLIFTVLSVSALKASAAVLNPTSDPYGAYSTVSDGPHFNENGGAGSLGASVDFSEDGTQHSDASANIHFAHVSATVGPQYSTASAIADFYDTYTIESSSLPTGSPAHIVITYFVEGTITMGGVCCVDLADGGHGSISYEVLTGAPGQSPLDSETLNFTQAWSSGCNCPYPPTANLDTGTQAIDKDLSVGDSIVVEIELTCAIGTAGADASCSESDPVSVTSTTSGVTIVSAAEQATTTTTTTVSTTETTTPHGVPEYSAPLAVTVAIAFLALSVVLRTRRITAV